MAVSSSPAARRKRAHESFQSAAECIGRLEPGLSLFAVTRGQFSMIDAVLACLDQTGPAVVSLWTWTIAEYEIECLNRLRIDQRLRSALLVIDEGIRHNSIRPTSKNLVRQWQQAFGPQSVRYVINHAKIATVSNDRWRLLLRGSMNLNFNPRFEQFDLTEGGEDFALVRRIEEEMPILDDSVTQEEVYKASKVSGAFNAEQLTLFAGIRPWAK